MVTATRPSLEMRTTRVFDETLAAWLEGKRRILHEGGTSSTKTWSILQALVLIAQNTKTPLLISVVSESLPHLKRGAIRDFFKILGETQDDNPRWSKTEFTYSWGLGTIEFFGADNADKVRGPRRDILFINEANNVPWETARGLDIRTTRFTIADWNPVGEFWAHENWLRQPENAYCHSTYKDALDVLPKTVIENIESNKDKDPNWWNIYGLGLVGKVEGLVFPNFKLVDSLPDGNYFYGLDYGFSSDPTVFVKNVLIGDNLYSHQLFYDFSGLTNPQIAQKFELLKIEPFEPIFADPSEPKSTEEIRQKGFNISDSVKGAGSKAFGIKKVNNYYQHWTKDSLECIKDQRNYRWLKDPNTGLFTDDTTHQWSHGCFASGTLIDTYNGQVPIEAIKVGDMVLTRQGYYPVVACGMTHLEADVKTIHFSNGATLTGTGNHPIYIKNKGFTPLDSCRYGDIIEVWKETQSFTKEPHTTGIRNHRTCLIGDITGGQTNAGRNICIERFGNGLTEKYQKASRYIIKTKILSIIRLIISKYYQYESTKQTKTIPTTHMTLSILPEFGLLLNNGMVLQRAESGIGNTQSSQYSIDHQLKKNVSSVAEHFQILKHYRKINSVQIPVNQNGAETQVSITRRASVLIARNLLRLISTVLRKHVPVIVLNVSAVKYKLPVYNLTVDAVPEYFANGILVHNCDARRYGVAAYQIPAGGRSALLVGVPKSRETQGDVFARYGVQRNRLLVR